VLRSRQALACAAGLLALSACAGPAAFEPPPQQAPAASRQHALLAADPDAEGLLAADIGPLEGGRFRWTGQRPTVRLQLQKTGALRLRARFWVAEDALRQTGPLEITYFVNNELIERARYSAAGEQLFEKPVAAGVLKTGANEVRMEIDKAYERNGAHLGVALVELGFVD